MKEMYYMSGTKVALFIAFLCVAFFMLEKVMRRQFDAQKYDTRPVATAAAPAPQPPVPVPTQQDIEKDQILAEIDRTKEIKQDPFFPRTTEETNASPFLVTVKRDVAQYALQRFLQGRHLQMKSPFTFYEFYMADMGQRTMAFETSPNQHGDELVVAIHSSRSARPQDLVNALAAEKGISPEKQVKVGQDMYTAMGSGLYILYFAGHTGPDEEAVVAWVSRSPHSTQDIATFKSALGR